MIQHGQITHERDGRDKRLKEMLKETELHSKKEKINIDTKREF